MAIKEIESVTYETSDGRLFKCRDIALEHEEDLIYNRIRSRIETTELITGMLSVNKWTIEDEEEKELFIKKFGKPVGDIREETEFPFVIYTFDSTTLAFTTHNMMEIYDFKMKFKEE